MYCWCWSAVQIHANHDCRTCRLFFCRLTLHISRFRQSEIVVMAFFSSSIYYFCITQEVRQLNKQFLVLSPPSLCLSLFAVRVCVVWVSEREESRTHPICVLISIFPKISTWEWVLIVSGGNQRLHLQLSPHFFSHPIVPLTWIHSLKYR